MAGATIAAQRPPDPGKNEAPGGQAGGFEEQSSFQNASPNDSAVDTETCKRRAEKEAATLVAEFALAGVELVQLADGSWLAQRWGLFRPLKDADDARAWLARVAGSSA